MICCNQSWYNQAYSLFDLLNPRLLSSKDPNLDDTIGSDLDEDEEDWETNGNDNNEEDIVSFLLNNALPRQKRVASNLSKKQVCYKLLLLPQITI